MAETSCRPFRRLIDVASRKVGTFMGDRSVMGGSSVGNSVVRKSRTSARARLRPKAQLTLPEEIRSALHVSEGDEIEFLVDEDGTVKVRGYVSVPSDLVWLYSQNHGDSPGAASSGSSSNQ
jgi:AbrB family looped-hinge helix DNA binding protein